MADLVPIPWQPHLYLTPHTLELLKKASRNYGVNLYVASPDGAWRSFARQLFYWLRWLREKRIVASSPWNGNRTHMRGAAFDLILTSARVQKACRDAGLIRDPAESWHWNDPLWRSMPIIKTRTSTAGLPSISILNSLGDDMRNIYINDQTIAADDRDIKVGATTWIHGAAGQYEVDKKLYGTRIKLSKKQAQKLLADVNRQRKQVGLAAITDPVVG